MHVHRRRSAAMSRRRSGRARVCLPLCDGWEPWRPNRDRILRRNASTACRIPELSRMRLRRQTLTQDWMCGVRRPFRADGSAREHRACPACAVSLFVRHARMSDGSTEPLPVVRRAVRGIFRPFAKGCLRQGDAARRSFLDLDFSSGSEVCARGGAEPRRCHCAARCPGQRPGSGLCGARGAPEKLSTDSQESNALMLMKRAMMLRGSASPRANFSGRPHDTLTALAAASGANVPRTALREAGEEPEGDYPACTTTLNPSSSDGGAK